MAGVIEELEGELFLKDEIDGVWWVGGVYEFVKDGGAQMKWRVGKDFVWFIWEAYA